MAAGRSPSVVCSINGAESGLRMGKKNMSVMIWHGDGEMMGGDECMDSKWNGNNLIEGEYSVDRWNSETRPWAC